eukprot:scaffold304_cov248-Pinguiococcus_pyrenoidosus.AAC.4
MASGSESGRRPPVRKETLGADRADGSELEREITGNGSPFITETEVKGVRWSSTTEDLEYAPRQDANGMAAYLGVFRSSSMASLKLALHSATSLSTSGSVYAPSLASDLHASRFATSLSSRLMALAAAFRPSSLKFSGDRYWDVTTKRRKARMAVASLHTSLRVRKFPADALPDELRAPAKPSVPWRACRLPSDLDIFSPSIFTKPLCIQQLQKGWPFAASLWAISFSW